MKMMYVLCGFIIYGVVGDSMMCGAATENKQVTQITNQITQITNITVNTVVYSCNCNGCVCNFYVGAVNDLREINVTAKEQKIGPITKALDYDIRVPSLGVQLLYSFSITVPASTNAIDKRIVNTPIRSLFISEKPSAQVVQLRPHCRAITIIYRQLFDEQLWTEVARLEHENAIEELPAFRIHIEPNGGISWPEGTEKRKISLGKVIMN